MRERFGPSHDAEVNFSVVEGEVVPPQDQTEEVVSQRDINMAGIARGREKLAEVDPSAPNKVNENPQN